MSIRPRTALALAAAALAMMAMAPMAGAVHPRPVSATPVQVSLVPAYNQCTATNRTHGPPLDYPSCNPPTQTSSSITVGTPDANGADANSRGSMRLATKPGVPGPPDDSDVLMVANITDVRCKAGTTACGSANAAAGADYTGEVQASLVIRITDHWNAVAPGGGPDAGTVTNIPFPVNFACVGTAATNVGGTCALSTTADAVYPTDPFAEGKRGIVALQQVQVRDGGPDGVMGTTPNRLFAVQGVFVP
jgi:hypothetical protein